MKFAVLFEDNPGSGETVRSRYMGEHLAFLERNASSVEAAGPLRVPGGAGAGGLWIVEAGTEADVRALVEADPFWPSGLRKSVRILQWTLVFADGERLMKEKKA